ncbi:MAG: 50S ribosomal protein L25/general stress protein Ctc [Candidatus Aegiribacteria sp.]|nr:50S ribosomal protein L25/general stress protein Ctc [Candidatus Aegiribacteria sp.]MBD3294772.1 50S ribosomal protein L25/general stress protein Ctc [Candidatus Fermentibacteria bacterium]
MPGKKKLKISERTQFGSRKARQLRRNGQIPSVVYGRGGNELNVTVDEKEFMDTIGYSTSSGIIELKMGKKSPVTAIVKDVQWDILTDDPLHIDFLRVSADQIVSIPVHVHLENTPVGVNMGGVLEQALHEIIIKVRAKDIPSVITVDVQDLDVGGSIHLSEVSLPEGMVLDMDSDLVVASVVAPSVAKVEVEEEEEEEALLEGEELPEGEEAPEGEEDTEEGSETPEE